MIKKNLMIGLTLLLISIIGIIVPTMISNQSGAQPSRSQDGEALLLSNQHIRSRRGYRFKYAGQFSFNTDDIEEELDEFEDEEELDETETINGVKEQEEQINPAYQSPLQNNSNGDEDGDGGKIKNDRDDNKNHDDDTNEIKNDGDGDKNNNDADANESKNDGDGDANINDNNDENADADDDSKNDIDKNNDSQSNDNSNNAGEDVESTSDDE